MLHAVIMAGGSGTRFWPESRADRPKQLLPLVGPRSMIQETVDRLGAAIPPERVLIVTSARHADEVARQLPQVPREAILGEPCQRDTAPCIGLAALHISRHDPDGTMIVMPADHAIRPDETFQAAILDAAELVADEPGRIVTFGIPPTYPAVGFGYIERGAPLTGPGVYKVACFHEKPPLAVAKEYLAKKTFYWNSGIFVWRARTILEALALHQPEMYARLQTISAAVGRPDFQKIFEHEFAAIRGVSIDYAVMERAKNVLVVEAPFGWDDVGSWQATARLRGVDEQGNTISAKHLGIKTGGTIVRAADGHLIVTVGLKDCIVVHTPDATLVANRDEEEAIREVVKLLAERGWKEHL